MALRSTGSARVLLSPQLKRGLQPSAAERPPTPSIAITDLRTDGQVVGTTLH
jgi:hypothetical protein